MVIFIDESGTHKQTGHSTSVVVYVEIKNLEEFEVKLNAIEKELEITHFHWAEERWLMKNKFLSRIFELDFIVKVAIFENPIKTESIIETVFQHLIVEKNIESIFIDGEKPKWYEHKLKKVLRDKAIAIKKLKTVRSKSKVGIQLADALAGLIRYHHDKPDEQDAKRWVKKLRKENKLAFELSVNYPKKTSPGR